jgi:hypothetical protein
LDAAASQANSIAPDYLGLEDPEVFPGCFGDALKHPHWGRWGKVFCNPPFSLKEEFLARGVASRYINDLILFVLPNNSRETSWWRQYVLLADEIINLSPRVNYYLDGKEVKGVGFPTCLAIYRPRIDGVDYGLPKELYWRWREE